MSVEENKVYRVKIEREHGQTETWDLLSNEDEIFNLSFRHLKDDMPSNISTEKICEKIENKDYEVYNLEDLDLTEADFDAE